ncbi:hypothetical protein B0H13DRAFT_1907290 [Mycena leptocephala]|nr:hypothetical protein B0H13DRAFT_1907290 [Mycena leptocephala]
MSRAPSPSFPPPSLLLLPPLAERQNNTDAPVRAPRPPEVLLLLALRGGGGGAADGAPPKSPPRARTSPTPSASPRGVDAECGICRRSLVLAPSSFSSCPATAAFTPKIRLGFAAPHI